MWPSSRISASSRGGHEFHELVVTGGDNTRLIAHYRTLMNQLAYHRLVSASLTRPGRLGASLSEHRHVLDLIREKDGFGAEFAMRDHVRSSERATMSLEDPLRAAHTDTQRADPPK